MPSGKFVRRFVEALGGELHRVRDRQWNLERFIVFQTVILKCDGYVTASQAGPGGTDSVSIQHWLLIFGAVSGELRPIFCGLHVVAEKLAPPMVCLSSHYYWLYDCTGKAARGQTGRGRRNLATIDGQVPVLGDGAGVQGRLWD